MEIEDEERYVDEFGRRLPIWRPKDPDKRHRFDTFSSAVEAVFQEMTKQRNPFFDSLADKWKSLFPDLPIRPGRFEDDKIFLYVNSAPILFAMRPKLAAMKKKLAALPDAPKKIKLYLEIRK